MIRDGTWLLISPEPVSLLSRLEMLIFTAWSPPAWAPLFTDVRCRVMVHLGRGLAIADGENGMPATFARFREPGGHV